MNPCLLRAPKVGRDPYDSITRGQSGVVIVGFGVGDEVVPTSAPSHPKDVYVRHGGGFSSVVEPNPRGVGKGVQRGWGGVKFVSDFGGIFELPISFWLLESATAKDHRPKGYVPKGCVQNNVDSNGALLCAVYQHQVSLDWASGAPNNRMKLS